jgi:branched-chain amino acid transport system permease protein
VEAQSALLVQAISNGLQIGLLYALVAVGLTIIWGLMETINFAHGELMMLGMFGAWWFSSHLGLDPLLMMLPIALVIFVVGTLIYLLLMRRVQRGEIFTQIFATFGLLLFIQNSTVAAFTSDYRFVSNTVLTNLSGINLPLGGLRVGVPLLLGGLIALVLFIALYLLIDRTELGLALQATSEDREAAILVGVKPQRMYMLAWGLGAALAAVAGVILANFFAVYPQVGLPFTILAYAIVALGGFGSILGTLVAALVVGVVESLTALYLPPAFKDAFVFAAYILVGLFRPQGLFGRF